MPEQVVGHSLVRGELISKQFIRISSSDSQCLSELSVNKSAKIKSTLQKDISQHFQESSDNILLKHQAIIH